MIKLQGRLAAVASLVNNGTKLADIGCDHGYVAVYLSKKNKISSCIATDINEKPLASCASLVEKYHLSDVIKTRLSDGLKEVNENECDDIVIAGMGGELIAEILNDCSFVKEKHLVLQPMTHPEILRKWLYDNEFEIINDFIVKEGCHHYVVLDAKYSNIKKNYRVVDLFFGNITDFSDKEYFTYLLKDLTNKQKSNKDYSQVIEKIKEIL